ncbi:MAG: protein disulfide oxidoreductase [Gammaproteobacteria bacterium]|nr:MAG: protein disulfide oxidoreductase [Gammaproteobacteria bacterium]
MAKTHRHNRFRQVTSILTKTGVYLLIFIVISQLVQMWQQRDSVSGIAPEVHALTIDGQQVSLSANSGKPLLLYFWASWCPVCRFQHDSMTDIAKDYEVISIAIQSGSDAEIRDSMKVEGADYPVVNDPDGYLANQYGIRGVPTSFIIDTNGKIRDQFTGYTTELSMRYRLWFYTNQ